MRYLISLVAFLATMQVYSQNDSVSKEHKGLLWEITGNGLTETSYLYGTMHVSGRIAFHLGEEFFAGLSAVDAIALESNPIIWLDEIVESPFANNYLGRYAIESQVYKGFYKNAFKIEPPENKDFASSLSSNHFLANWMLYRESAQNKEFEEDTFLDMFIYQAGSKQNKPVYSLEDFTQTSAFSMMSRIPDIEPKETSEWYKKLTKEKSYYEILEDSYRNQDLDMLDSLQKETSSRNNMKYMLYLRNEIMADNIDSIIQSGTSLFIGIGAAHLANSKGVIGLLRSMGYIVQPAKRTFSEKAKSQKEKLSKLKKPVPFTYSYSTELFQLVTPGKVYETPAKDNERQFFSPELTNGTFYTFKIISTYKHLNGQSKIDYLAKIDSLLFENIPGRIESKKRINQNGFEGLDILNKTKTGDYQKYRIIETPINVMIFKMGGKHDFVKSESDNFFSTLTLSVPNKDWVQVSTIKKDFVVDLPSYFHTKANTKATSMYAHPEIEAYDPSDSSYFLVKRASLHDLEFIEEDNFELKRIAEKFYKEIKIDSFETKIDSLSEFPTATSEAKTVEGKTIRLKIYIKGAFYYLQVAVCESQEKIKRFFDSFQFSQFEYAFPFENRIDSTLNFRVNSNYISPNPYTQMIRKGYEMKRNRKETEDKSYLSSKRKETYYSENYERVLVECEKFHRYQYFKHLDTLFNKELRLFAKKEKLELKSKTRGKVERLEFVDAVFIDTNSNRTIRKKLIVNKGTLYTLTTNLDTLSKESKFISEFYGSFTPTDSTNQLSLTESKSQLFFDALLSGDSTEKEMALKSVVTTVEFDDEDSDKIMEVIANYSFSSNHVDAKAKLIESLARLKNPTITPFLENLYSKVEDTAMYQLAILKALANRKTKESSKLLVKLIEADIPLSSSTWGTSWVFYPFYDSLSLTKYVYPDLLNFTFVEEYKKPIYDLMLRALDSSELKTKVLKKDYKQLLREAKIELKSQISTEQTAMAKEGKKKYYYTSYKNQGNYELLRYCRILVPFYSKSAVREFFKKTEKVQDYKVQTDIACLKVIHGIKVSNETWLRLAQDVINVQYLYSKLKRIDRLDLFPKSEYTQEGICKSVLYERGFDFSKDSLLPITKIEVEVKGKKGFVYFFKSKGEKDDNWELDYIGLQPLDSSKINIVNLFKSKGERISKDKDLDELIEEKLKEIELKGHPRANESEDNFGGGYDYF